MSVILIQVLILIALMIVIGLIVGFVAGLIWKDDRPFGVKGDYLIAIISSIAIGLMDWFVIPAMGFSETLKLIGVVTEPPLGALAILWLVRRAKK